MSTHQWVFIMLFTVITKFILTQEMQTLEYLWVIVYTEYHLTFFNLPTVKQCKIKHIKLS